MKSINKKILTVLVTLVLLIGLLGGTMATAYAESSGGMVIITNAVTVYTDETELVYSPDAEYDIPVYGRISGEGVSTFQIALNVPEFLTVVDVYTENEGAESSLIATKTISGVRVSYTTQEYLLNGNCELFVITVKTAVAGNSNGNFSIDNDFKALFVTPNARPVPHSCEFGMISVVTEGFANVMGDLNLDAEVTLADVICLQRYIVTNNDGMTGEIFGIADIDRNGELDSIDVQYIQMYLVGAITSLDNVNGGGPGDEGTQGYSLYVNVCDQNGNRIAENEWTNIEAGTLYPAIVGDYVSNFIDQYQAEVIRVTSDCYGEITTEQAEKAILVQSDIVYVYLGFTYSGGGNTEIKETVKVLVEGKDVADLVLYSTSYFELLYEGEIMDRGKYKFRDEKTLVLAVDGGLTIVLEYDANKGYYLITETTGGGGSGEGSGDVETSAVTMRYYYLMDGNYVEVGGTGSDMIDPTETVYNFASTRHIYGESVTVSGVYYDDTFNTEVPFGETLKENSIYYVKLADVTLNTTFDLYEQRVTMTGGVSMEHIGSAVFSNGSVTIISLGEYVGKTYSYSQQLGQIDIIKGTYSQILAQVSGNMLVIFQDLDLSVNTTDETLTPIAGDYEMPVPFAPIPYRISLYDNHVCVIRSGGDVRILSEYFYDGKNITFTMMKATFTAEVDAENGILNFVSGGGASGGGSVGGDVSGGGSADDNYQELKGFVGFILVGDSLYPMASWEDMMDVPTVGAYVSYLELEMTGLKVISIHKCSFDNPALSLDEPFDSGAVYVGIVEDCNILGTYDIATEINSETTMIGTLTLTETGATVTYKSGAPVIGTFTRVLNNVEVNCGEFRQVCFTIVEGVAYLEYAFDGSDYQSDERFESAVGVYELVIEEEGAMMAPMVFEFYDNGVCRMYYPSSNVGSFYEYDFCDEGVIVYEDEDFYSIYVLDKEYEEAIFIRSNYENGYVDNGGGTVTDKNESGTVTDGTGSDFDLGGGTIVSGNVGFNQ